MNICKIFWYKTVAIFTDIQLQSCIIMTSAREENLKINLGKGHQCKFSVSGYHILNRSCESHQFPVIFEQKSSFLLKIRFSIKIRRLTKITNFRVKSFSSIKTQKKGFEPKILAQNSIFEFKIFRAKNSIFDRNSTLGRKNKFSRKIVF